MSGKKPEFNRSLYKCFKVLGNPVRLDIFKRILHEACECNLDERGEIYGNCVSHISSVMKLPQPTVSNHVKELVGCGLIKTVKQGKRTYLFGNQKIAQEMQQFGNFVVTEVYNLPH